MRSALPTLRHSARLLLLCLTALCCSIFWPVAPASAETPEVLPNAEFSIDWLEPQGINIVDLVGALPEQHLKGATITYTPGFGTLTYESGSRQGDTVTVTALASTRYIIDGGWSGTLFSCLGQPARIDQLGTVSPATTLRVYQGARDVTREVDLFSYLPAGKRKPFRNPRESEAANLYRYWETDLAAPSRTSDGQISLPANMGCELVMSGKDYRDLKLVFTAHAPKTIDAKVTGQENFIAHSYLGPGFAGHLTSLAQQLYGAGYKSRGEVHAMTVPPGSDYFFVNYPKTNADAYTSFRGNPTGNIDRPSSGTYRVAINAGLSIDHVVSMGLPLRGHWQDIDQADGTWLRYDATPLKIGSPEYILAPGIPFDNCMVFGGCSPELLARVYTTPATIKVFYLSVSRVESKLERLPLQMVGGGYHFQGQRTADGIGGLAGSTVEERVAISEAAAVPEGARRYRILLPHASFKIPPVPPDDPTGCSSNGGCGWFTPDGRMVDYIPYH